MLLNKNLFGFKIKFKRQLLKSLILCIFKASLCFLRYYLRTDFGLIKFTNYDERKNEYLNEYNKLKNRFKNDSFINDLLNEISVISLDYTDKLKPDNSQIHIIMNMNNQYIYPTLISMNSILRNSNKNRTTIVYHILCPEELKRGNINKLKSFLFLYPTNLKLIFYNMGNLFNNLKKNRFSEVTFYRLLTPLFIPLERIIYLDSDVLAFEDLEEMYHLPLNNNYVLGFLDFLSDGVDYIGLKSEKYINAGVLLLNLDLIRKDLKYYDLLYMAKNYKKLKNNDQTIINYVFYPNIGILPSKFGIFNFESIFDIKYIYLKKIRQSLNFTELVESFKHPTLMHYVLCNPKVWFPNSLYTKKNTRTGTLKNTICKKYHDIWIELAKNTSFYKEIKRYINSKNK